MSIKIIKPGLFTTVQDEGRKGYMNLGFSEAGALDKFSYLIAKHLIGTGGQFNAKLNGNPIQTQVIYEVHQGDILEIGNAIKGARGYITFGQPLDIPKVANSYATHTRSKMGGFKGRALKKDDVIDTVSLPKYKKYVGQAAEINLNYEDNVIHIVEGPQIETFSEEAKAKLVENEFIISDMSDRMGFRLKGESIQPEESADIISETVG